jgi:hypothetical protein
MTPSGPPETVLPAESEALLTLLGQIGESALADRAVLASAIASAPRSPSVWSVYGHCASEVIEKYAAYRVGYHRGLDALRANGWRGSGFVRWKHASNVGFLRCLLGLAVMAKAIGENDEADRCELFLLQLDPSGVPPHERNAI